MTAQIVSRAHRAGALLRVPTRPRSSYGPPAHRYRPGSPTVHARDLVAAAQIAPRRQLRRVKPYAPLTGRAVWLARLAWALLAGAALVCFWDLATPDAAALVVGSTFAAGRSPLQRLRRFLLGEQRHTSGCEHTHLYGRCSPDPGADGVEILDPLEYALFVTMRADNGEVRIEHQIGDDTRAARDMARLAAEIIDEIGIHAVNSELVRLDLRHAQRPAQ